LPNHHFNQLLLLSLSLILHIQMENNHDQKPHAVMFAYPLQGHVIPFVHLAMKLASKGFTITFINTLSIHHHVTKSQPHIAAKDNIFAGARESGLDIRYTTVSDGFPIGFDRSLNHDQYMEGLLHVLSAHVDEIVGKLVQHSDPPITCLIADTFFVWTSMIAEKYNLVNVSFWTEPVLVFTLYYHLDLLRKNGHFASQGTCVTSLYLSLLPFSLSCLLNFFQTFCK
ncbi:hypothetical protein F2P56_008626, partial [Juglans regia]